MFDISTQVQIDEGDWGMYSLVHALQLKKIFILFDLYNCFKLWLYSDSHLPHSCFIFQIKATVILSIGLRIHRPNFSDFSPVSSIFPENLWPISRVLTFKMNLGQNMY